LSCEWGLRSIDFVIKEDKDSITRSQKWLLLTFAWEGSAATLVTLQNPTLYL